MSQTFVRRRSDTTRVCVGASVLIVCSLIAARQTLSSLETSLFNRVNSLPGGLYVLLWPVMQLGSVATVFVATGAAFIGHRARLAAELLAAGLIAYFAATGVKHLVDRGRPADLLHDIVVHGPAAHGLGFPSGHAAVSCALAVTAVRFVSRRWRPVVWAAPLVVGFARVFVGAHFPLDVVGGFALGYTIAVATHLVAGSPA